MIVVTGGMGFIGSNIIRALNLENINDILVVDDLTDGIKFRNLLNCQILDYEDKDSFLTKILKNEFSKEKIMAILHNGACTSTTEWNGKLMMDSNYTYSKALLHYSIEQKIPFIYASSASVYGVNTVFKEGIENEHPINIYGYSKFLFDQHVRDLLLKTDNQIVGLRYFNVYGPGENHKGNMASVVFHFNNQIKKTGVMNLFGAYGDSLPGEQKRDFVYVGDIANINAWFLKNPDKRGIYNLGTGKAESFNDLAKEIVAWYEGKAKIKYIPFPENLEGFYQSFTQADITKLRNVGYEKEFRDIKEGVKIYMDWLNS